MSTDRGAANVSNVAIFPATRRWRPYLESEAVRIFGGLAGSSRNKVRNRLIADAASKGVARAVAEADADEGLALLDARIAIYVQAKSQEPFAPRLGRLG